MLNHSPKGSVPVLITKSGQVIDESLDVMLWALAQHDPGDWLLKHKDSLALVEENDQHFKPLLDRYKYADRHPKLTEAQHREIPLPFIKYLDKRLKNTKNLISAQITLADVALYPFIRQYAFVNKPWFDQLPYQHVQQWLGHFLDSKLFKQIMPKYKLFNDGFRYQLPSGELLM